MILDQLLARASGYASATLEADSLKGGMVSFSFPDVIQQVRGLQEQLTAAGFRPGHQVGIKAGNSLEWVLWDLAVTTLGGVIVALPDELRVNNADALLEEHDLALLAHGCEFTTFNTGAVIDLTRSPFDLTGKQVRPSARGAANPDLLTKVYSSGTTGHLKGLLISRAGTEHLVTRFIADFALGYSDHHLIFLPLSNFQQRMSVYGCLWSGASLRFTVFTNIFNALKTFAPTFLISPPVLYENLDRIYRPDLDGGARLKEGLGGRMRFLITGMAPIRRAVLQSFNQAGVELLEVYGVTETGMIAWNLSGQNRIGTVGRGIWPEDLLLDDEGQILIRRALPLSLGYFSGDATATANVFCADGIIATGDIGSIDESGWVTLRGRIKDIVITPGGKKFHPSEVESAFLTVAGVQQVAIVNSQAQFFTAVIITDGVDDQERLQAINRSLSVVNEGLEAYKRVQRLVFADQPFTVGNGCLTGNLKINRKGIHTLYRHQIESQSTALVP